MSFAIKTSKTAFGAFFEAENAEKGIKITAEFDMFVPHEGKHYIALANSKPGYGVLLWKDDKFVADIFNAADIPAYFEDYFDMYWLWLK